MTILVNGVEKELEAIAEAKNEEQNMETQTKNAVFSEAEKRKTSSADILNRLARQLNAAAGLIGDVPHPAAEAYLKISGSLTLEELANLLLQEEQLPDAEGLEGYSREQIRGQGPDLSFYRMEEIIKSHGKAEQALPENRREPAETF